jgi:F-box-like
MSELPDDEINTLCRRLETTSIDHPGSHTPSWADLPPELLAQILLYHVEECESLISNHIRYPKISPKSSLLTITHISSSWRATAIALPELWNRVGISYRASQREFDGSRISLLHTWLERSYPLAIHMHFAMKFHFEPPAPMDPNIIDAIACHSSRIESLSIEAHTGKEASGRLLFPEEGTAIGLPGLKNLSLSVAMQTTIGEPPTAITIFKDCQSLTKLSLDAHSPTPSLLCINWAQLTELDMLDVQKPLHRSRWMRLIRMCKNLRKGWFTLRTVADLSANWIDDELRNEQFLSVSLEGPCHLNHLEELRIDHTDADTLTSLLHGLHFKRLYKLVVHADSASSFGSQRMSLGTWTKLHQLSSLVSFTICHVNVVTDDFVSLLGTLALLEELQADLEALPIATALRIDAMAQDGVVLLLKLRRLRLWVRSYSHEEHTIYLDMLKSRVDWTAERHGYDRDDHPSKFSVHLLIDSTKPYGHSLDPLQPFGLEEDDYLWPHIRISSVSPYYRFDSIE